MPDVAANRQLQGQLLGDPGSAGRTSGGNGTSAVGPLSYAGLFAVINQAFGQQMGFINPLIYQLGESLFQQDITVGKTTIPATARPSSTQARAGTACTGWGRFDGTKLINGIAGALYSQIAVLPGGQEHLRPRRGEGAG